MSYKYALPLIGAVIASLVFTSNVSAFTPPPLTIPSAPLNLVATIFVIPDAPEAVSLAWNAPVNPGSGGVKYRVLRGGAEIVRGLTARTYIDYDVYPGITYAYEVQAIDKTGYGFSPSSNVAAVSLSGFFAGEMTVAGVTSLVGPAGPYRYSTATIEWNTLGPAKSRISLGTSPTQLTNVQTLTNLDPAYGSHPFAAVYNKLQQKKTYYYRIQVDVTGDGYFDITTPVLAFHTN